MTADSLLKDLRARGLRIAAAGQYIEVRGPLSAFTPDLREAVREHKGALLDLLANGSLPQMAPLAADRFDASEFVERLLERGVAFAEREGWLLWFAPFPLGREIAATLRLQKAEILKHLRLRPVCSSGCWSRRSWGDPAPCEFDDLARQVVDEVASKGRSRALPSAGVDRR
jgi:hypothetical protein